MNQAELKHEIVIDADSWFVRFYLWLWQVDEDSINFCKLFWGYVFMPIALLVHLGVFVLGPAVRYLLRKQAERKELAASEPRLEFISKPKEKKPSRLWVWLDRFEGSRAARYSAYFFWLVALLLALAGAGLLVYLIVNHLVVSGIIVGATLLTVGIVMLILWFITTPAAATTGAVAFKIELSFRQLLKGGYQAVKTNTCPRISLKK